jgi:predicted RNA binding protein YcfA (HicA-like mRNA interferase family)
LNETVGIGCEPKEAITNTNTHEAGIVTVPGNPGKDMAVGTLNNILKQAGLKP